jgi:PncC family amidohydrolase
MKRVNNQLVKFLQSRGETLALAESVTAGLACHQLACVKGACDVLMGGIVCYDEKVKINLLGVKASLIKKYTAESQQVTDALALYLSHKIKADVFAAITGLAADGGSETKTKPVGTVFFSVRYRNKTHRKRAVYKGKPLEIREAACKGLFRFILEILKPTGE